MSSSALPQDSLPPRRQRRIGKVGLVCGLAVSLLPMFWPANSSAQSRKHYWATSLTRTVEPSLLQGLRDALARGEVGWLDVDPKFSAPVIAPGTNLILYHVGGNCYLRDNDCSRFSKPEQIGGMWGDKERKIDLADPANRKVVIADLIKILQRADELAPKRSTIGVHVDNLHKVDADGLATFFNEYLQAVEAAKQQGLIAKDRVTGYIAKNNPRGFAKALDEKLLAVPPLYQINENAKLNKDGVLDRGSRAAQEMGERFGIPVFLKTFGSDVAYRLEQGGKETDVFVSPDMTKQMTTMPDISGAAWSPDEERYHPTLFFQGSAVRQVLFPARQPSRSKS